MGSGGVGGGLKRPLRRLCPPQRLLQVMLRMRSGNRVVGEKAVFDGENRDRSETPLGEDQIGADGRLWILLPFYRHNSIQCLHPQLPVQRPILNRLADVIEDDFFSSREIGDCAADLQDPVVGAGTEAELIDGGFERLHRLTAEGAEFFEMPRGHVGIAMHVGDSGEAVALDLPGAHDALTDFGRRFAIAGAGEFTDANGGDVDVQVDAIEQRAADSRQILLDHRRRAGAFLARVLQISAWTGVHRTDQQKLRGKTQRSRRARNGHNAVFQRLAQHFKRLTWKFGHFV